MSQMDQRVSQFAPEGTPWKENKLDCWLHKAIFNV